MICFVVSLSPWQNAHYYKDQRKCNIVKKIPIQNVHQGFLFPYSRSGEVKDYILQLLFSLGSSQLKCNISTDAGSNGGYTLFS